jgi:hypothetical protein
MTAAGGPCPGSSPGAGKPTPAIGDSKPAPLSDPRTSLRDARVILDHPGALTSPGWVRSVVLLIRQALEDAVAAFWMRRAPGTEQASGKSRFVALRFYLDDPAVARRAHHTWAVLSDATHHHGYDLAPTAEELRTWFDTVTEIVDLLGPPAASTVGVSR